MKLRNKKTREIGEVIIGIGGEYYVVAPNKFYEFYDSATELAEEWEEYEEPKEYWYLSGRGEVRCIEDDGVEFDKDHKEIGNYFSSKEEAELAVRKLKAFKRLKDKGFRFTLTPGVGSLDIAPGKFQIEINADMPAKWFCCDAVQKDLDDCFGGEE